MRPICAAFIVVGLAVGCRDEARQEVPTARATRGTIERVVVASGTIEPVKQLEVRPRLAGIIERIHVEEGQAVTEGQPLLDIETDLLESQVEEAEAVVEEARIQLRFSEVELARARKLVDSKAQSPQHLDDMRTRHDAAASRVARAEAALRTLTTQLSYAHLLSPLAGRVMDLHVEVGSAVSPVTAVTGGTLLLTLAAADTLHLDGLVDENEVSRIAVGQPARIRTESFPDNLFEGRVRKIADLGQRVQNVTYFRTEIEITDADAGLLRLRMSGEAEIVTEVVDHAVLVPETALHYRGDEVFVRVPNGDGFVERGVRIGILEGKRVQILEGLEPDEVVTIE